MSIIGVDLGGTNVRAGLVEGGRLARVETAAVHGDGPEKAVLEDIFGVIDPLIGAGIEGIGVGVPSVVDLKGGVIYDVQNIPSWKKVPLKALLEERYRIPSYVNNDANCFATGEKYFGKGKPYDNFVGLILGTGLGAGIIANGRLFSGANCGAGEFGMLPYKDRNFEYYACGQFFKNVHGTSGKALAERARKGDAAAMAVFCEFGGHLGQAMKAVLYAADPEVVILGGSVSKSYALFKDAMWKAMQDFAYSITLQKIRVEISETENIAVLGAAALYLDALAQ
ncbi:MAG: ROK family protein [Candidatus Aminicenantes bacterium]|nr:ROK family protein [Candidatus Aminicenantes bacterium]